MRMAVVYYNFLPAGEKFFIFSAYNPGLIEIPISFKWR
jgi:hypothetical protein